MTAKSKDEKLKLRATIGPGFVVCRRPKTNAEILKELLELPEHKKQVIFPPGSGRFGDSND